MNTKKRKIWIISSAVIFLIIIIIAGIFLFPFSELESILSGNSDIGTTQPASATPSPITGFTETPGITSTISISDHLTDLMVISQKNGNYSHLFIWNPETIEFTQFTFGSWNNISPAISPDGTQIAFSSNKEGYYDLYLLSLEDLSVSKLTDTTEYDANPSWSSDGKWLVFESYLENDMELMILSMETNEIIQLTDNEILDCSPAWSPDGRKIAYVSETNKNLEIWVIDLDDTENRFTNVTKTSDLMETNPAWSSSGQYLSWSAQNKNGDFIYIYDVEQKKREECCQGNRAEWISTSDSLAVQLNAPNQEYLYVINRKTREIVVPAIPTIGSVSGFEWKSMESTHLINNLEKMGYEPSILWNESESDLPSDGQIITNLVSSTAPYAYLHKNVIDSYEALHAQSSYEIGWDFLNELEMAYLPLTGVPEPGFEENWFYTGRAFGFDTAALYADWIKIVKEIYNGQTYWRVFVKAQNQDGSQGQPLNSVIWNFLARMEGNPKDYEAGGAYEYTPSGYWIDFTELSSRYQWERLPAQHSWRVYLSSSNFNIFIQSEGKSWNEAMTEIYPIEALYTATPIPFPSLTPSETPEGYLTPETNGVD